jgi:hypothetical protein
VLDVGVRCVVVALASVGGVSLVRVLIILVITDCIFSAVAIQNYR